MNNSWLRRYGRNVALAVLAVVTVAVVAIALTMPTAADETSGYRAPTVYDDMFKLFTDR